MAGHLVLVGGGHAHLTVLLRLRQFIRRGHRVTLVSPAPFHYYSGMGPGLLGGMYEPCEARFDVGAMAEKAGARFIAGRALSVDPATRTILLQGGEILEYDVASFNVGSVVPLPSGMGALPPTVYPVKPIENLLEARVAVREALARGTGRFLVVGGGPAGVEIAGNLWRLASQTGAQAEITLVTRGEILAGAPERVRALARSSLSGRGIILREGAAVGTIEEGRACLADGAHVPFDAAFLAAGVTPPGIFRRSALPVASDGGLMVNAFLQGVSSPRLFGGGDCIGFDPGPLAKVGVYAVRENRILLANLMAALEGSALRPFSPQRRYMLILNMGDGTGLLWRGGFRLHGRLPLWFKERIDRRFVERFQISEECG